MARAEVVASYAALAAVLLFTVLVRINLLEVPLERDEGTYAYFAQLLLDGATPYLSFYEIKPPGLYYAYALLLALFGDTLRGLHTAFLFVNLGSTLLLFLIGRKLLSPLGGAIVAAAFAILSLGPEVLGFTAQSEHLVVLFVAASLYAMLLARESRRTSLFVASGTLVALACMVKQAALPLLVFHVGLIASDHLLSGRRDRTGSIRAVAALLAPAGLLYVGTALVMGFAGAFREYWFWTHAFPLGYATEIGLATGWERFLGMSRAIGHDYLALWSLAGIGLLAAPFAGLGRNRTVLVWLLFLCSLASICQGLRFYGHYALQLLPSAAILVGVSFELVRRLLAVRLRFGPGYAALGATAYFALAVSITVVKERDYYFRPDFEEIIHGVYGNNPFVEAKVFGEFIRANTEPGDEVAVIGSEPEIYFYSGRRCPSRHAYFDYIVAESPRQADWQREFIRDVEAARPKYLVYFHNSFSLGPHVEEVGAVFDWFVGFSKRHYRVVARADYEGAGHRIQYLWGPEAGMRTNLAKSSTFMLERIDPP